MAETALEILLKARDQTAQVLGGVSKAAGKLKQDWKSLVTEVPGLGSALSILSNPIALTVGGLTAIAGFAVDATKKANAYNKEIREMAQATGLSAEETSRIIQVANDWGIEIGEIRSALSLMNRNGISPSIENLANLADEFVNATDKAAFAETATKKYGRGWQTLIPILAEGGQSLKDQAAAINEAQVATEENIAETRRFEVGMDDLNDKVEIIQRRFANGFIPVLNDVLDVYDELQVEQAENLKAQDEINAALDKGILKQDDYNVAMGRAAHGGVEPFTEATEDARDAMDRYQYMTDIANKQITAMKDAQIAGIQPSTDWALQQYDAAIAAGELEEKTGLAVDAILDLSKAEVGRQALDALKAAYDRSLIGPVEYEAKTRAVLESFFDLGQDEIAVGIALDNLKKDFDAGRIGPEQYYQTLTGIWNTFQKLNGQNFETTYTITTVGAAPGTVAAAGNLPAELRQHGGPTVPGGIYLVGERGPEILFQGRGGGFVTPTNVTNNFNLNLTSLARAEQVAGDFRLMQAWAR